MSKTVLPPALMFQGVSSSAGKSLLAAALCRILARRGLAVVPFKAQNMSLNSWVTADGGEMGIAQALQAKACFLAPHVNMNPVLLKPLGVRGSQVIVLGKPAGTMPYSEYIRIKPEIQAIVKRAYCELCRNCDLVILEGAGSPAEINLARHDIVNMAMARFAGAKVLLVADIDRGGAFASIYGTMALLAPEECELVAGFVLNKFRGDKKLLDPALKTLTAIWDRPFLGIVPMLADLRLPEEDSAGSGFGQYASDKADLDVAVVALPHLSNIADWDPFASEKGVHVRMVKNGADLGSPDLLVLPGSRNVPASLAWLRQTGLYESVLAYGEAILAGANGEICGICAGLQLLGRRIEDPESLEGGGSHKGAGLLPLVTVLCKNKVLAQQQATVTLADRKFRCSGYEIHHGKISENGKAYKMACADSGEVMAYARDETARIWGTWLHGIFGNDSFRHALLERVAKRAGKNLIFTGRYEPEKELDRLADAVEASLDMNSIWKLVAQKRKQS